MYGSTIDELMAHLSDVDIAQTEAQIVNLIATRSTLDAAGLSTLEVNESISKLQNLLTPPPPAPQQPPAEVCPPNYVTIGAKGTKSEVRWKSFYYAGGWYAAPKESDRSWDLFVAAYGPDIANDPKNRHPLSIKKVAKHVD